MSVICFTKGAYDCTIPFYFILDCFKTQGICIKVAQKKPWTLEAVPDYFKTREMCSDVVEKVPWVLRHVPDCYKTQEMCDYVVEERPCALGHVPDRLKTQKMYDDAVRKGFFFFFFCGMCLNWFVTQLQVKIIQYDWYNNGTKVIKNERLKKQK